MLPGGSSSSAPLFQPLWFIWLRRRPLPPSKFLARPWDWSTKPCAQGELVRRPRLRTTTPRLARHALSRLMLRVDFEALTVDLDEIHCRKRDRLGKKQADKWYRLQIIREGTTKPSFRAYRLRMQMIRAAADERTFYELKSLHFEKLVVGPFELRASRRAKGNSVTGYPATRRLADGHNPSTLAAWVRKSCHRIAHTASTQDPR
jgi:hypothetical protein